MLPFVPGAVPWHSGFAWKFVNYAPVVTIGALILLSIWWQVSAKHWFTGPKHTIDEAVVEAFDELTGTLAGSTRAAGPPGHAWPGGPGVWPSSRAA